MDDRFTVPGTQYRIGLDGIIGLIPVVGDLVMAFVGSVILKEARRLGASRWTRARMYFNYGIDFLIGVVPVVGDLLDFGFKAHRRNLRLLQQHLDREANRATTPARISTAWIVAGILAAVVAIGLIIWFAF